MPDGPMGDAALACIFHAVRRSWASDVTRFPTLSGNSSSRRLRTASGRFWVWGPAWCPKGTRKHGTLQPREAWAAVKTRAFCSPAQLGAPKGTRKHGTLQIREAWRTVKTRGFSSSGPRNWPKVRPPPQKGVGRHDVSSRSRRRNPGIQTLNPNFRPGPHGLPLKTSSADPKPSARRSTNSLLLIPSPFDGLGCNPMGRSVAQDL